MPFTIGSRPPSRASNTASPSPTPSRAHMAPPPGRASTSKPSVIPDERTSLLGSDRQSDVPKRSWTADLDAVQLEDDGRAPGGDGDSENTGSGKRDDGDRSIISRDYGGESSLTCGIVALPLTRPAGDNVKRKRVRQIVRQRAKYYIPVGLPLARPTMSPSADLSDDGMATQLQLVIVLWRPCSWYLTGLSAHPPSTPPNIH